MSGITLNVLGNFRDFLRGAGDADKALDKVADSLDDVVKDGDKGVERLEKSFRDLAKEAKDTGRDIEKGIGDGTRDGTRKAKKGLDDFKGEAGQSGREAAASFSGEFSDVADFAQETLANGLAGFGPIGAAAGIAAAAGLGALWNSIDEQSKEAEQRISDMYDDFVESGSKFLTESFIQEKVIEIGRDTAKFADALKVAEENGISVQTVMRAMAGDQDAISTAVDATNQKREEELAKLGESSQGAADFAAKQDAINLKADETIAKVQGINGEMATAQERAAAVRASFETGNVALDKAVQKVQNIAAGLAGIGDKTIRLTADDSDIQRKLGLLQGRTINVNVHGQITRIGNQVW